MAGDEKKVVVPEPPGYLPDELKKKWSAAYAAAHAAASEEQDAIGRHQAALKEANKVLRIVPPRSYDEAMNLKDHEVAHRKVGRHDYASNSLVDDGVLRVVTADGKKYQFPVPKGKQATATPAAQAS